MRQRHRNVRGFVIGLAIGLSIWALDAVPQDYYGSDTYNHYHDNYEERRQLQNQFLNKQLENQMIMKDLYQWDREKHEREQCERYNISYNC